MDEFPKFYIRRLIIGGSPRFSVMQKNNDGTVQCIYRGKKLSTARGYAKLTKERYKQKTEKLIMDYLPKLLPKGVYHEDSMVERPIENWYINKEGYSTRCEGDLPKFYIKEGKSGDNRCFYVVEENKGDRLESLGVFKSLNDAKRYL